MLLMNLLEACNCGTCSSATNKVYSREMRPPFELIELQVTSADTYVHVHTRHVLQELVKEPGGYVQKFGLQTGCTRSQCQLRGGQEGPVSSYLKLPPALSISCSLLCRLLLLETIGEGSGSLSCTCICHALLVRQDCHKWK